MVLGVAVLAAHTGCYGKSCTKRPDSSERQEALQDEMSDVLDDADVPDGKEDRLLKLAGTLRGEREALAAHYEPVRKKILNEVLQTKPRLPVLRHLVDAAAKPMIAYAHRVTNVMLVGHAMLAPDERGRVVDAVRDMEDDQEGYESSFVANRGFDIFLWQLDVKGPQEIRIREMKASVEHRLDGLSRQQHRHWKTLLTEFRRNKPNRKRLHHVVDTMSSEMVGFAKHLAGVYVTAKGLLDSQQKERLDEHVSRLRRCTD